MKTSSYICLCGKQMKNLGNIDNLYFTSNPPQWNEILVCGDCKTKKVLRCSGGSDTKPDLQDYTNI